VINALIVNWASNESYEVSSKENMDKTVSPLSGNKTFTYSFICTKTGQYVLPPVKLSYFDPASQTYKTVESNPLHITANRSNKKKHSPVTAVSASPLKTKRNGYI
jgi:hypothetical protein